jgi:hypothetical protein
MTPLALLLRIIQAVQRKRKRIHCVYTTKRAASVERSAAAMARLDCCRAGQGRSRPIIRSALIGRGPPLVCGLWAAPEFNPAGSRVTPTCECKVDIWATRMARSPWHEQSTR